MSGCTKKLFQDIPEHSLQSPPAQDRSPDAPRHSAWRSLDLRTTIRVDSGVVSLFPGGLEEHLTSFGRFFCLGLSSGPMRSTSKPARYLQTCKSIMTKCGCKTCRLPQPRLRLFRTVCDAKVARVGWWMGHFNAPTPKRHYGFSNSQAITALDRGVLKGWAKEKPADSRTPTAVRYVDSARCARYHGTERLTETQRLL